MSATVKGAMTLPRVKSASVVNTEDTEPSEGSGRFRKNYQKHSRGASESVVAMQRETEGRSSMYHLCYRI